MTTKTNTNKIEDQPNTERFVWTCNNPIENKPKQIINPNSKSTKYWRMKLKKKTKEKNNIEVWNWKKIKERKEGQKKKNQFKSTQVKLPNSWYVWLPHRKQTKKII